MDGPGLVWFGLAVGWRHELGRADTSTAGARHATTTLHYHVDGVEYSRVAGPPCKCSRTDAPNPPSLPRKDGQQQQQQQSQKSVGLGWLVSVHWFRPILRTCTLTMSDL